MTVAEQGSLKRQVGLWGATISGTGVIIGAGVYALIGEGAGLAGGAVWLAFVLAAGVAALSGITYARMGPRVPKNSPEFQYAGHGLGMRTGFLAGWLMSWGDLVSAAAVALGFGGYFAALTGVPALVPSLLLILGLAVVVWVGIKESVVLVTVLTVVEVLGLALVAVIGIPHWGEQNLLEMPNGFSGVWSAASLIFFAYIGFDEVGNLAEEMRNPERDLPRAITLAMVTSTVLYVLVAVSAVSLIGAQALANSSAPLADAVAGSLGPAGRVALALIALAATTSTVLLLLLAGSRSLYGMARAGALPAALGRVGKRQTPLASILVIVAITCAFTVLGDIAAVAKITTLSTLVSFVLVNVSLAAVLRRESNGWRAASRGWRLLGLVQPLLGAVACLWLATRTSWLAVGFGAGLALVGFLIGTWIAKRKQL